MSRDGGVRNTLADALRRAAEAEARRRAEEQRRAEEARAAEAARRREQEAAERSRYANQRIDYRRLGETPPQSPEVRARLEAQAQFDRLAQHPDTWRVMQQAGIRDAESLRAWSADKARELSQNPDPHALSQQEKDAQVAYRELYQAAVRLNPDPSSALGLAAHSEALNQRTPAEYVSEFHEATERALSAQNTCGVDGDAGDGQTMVDATEALRAEIARVPEDMRAEVLRAAAPDLKRLFDESAKSMNGAETEQFIQNLAYIADKGGPQAAAIITDPLAQAIHEGKLLENDKGSGKYVSVQEFVDGVKAINDDHEVGAANFRNALTNSLAHLGDENLAETMFAGRDVVENLPAEERQALHNMEQIEAATAQIHDGAHELTQVGDASNADGKADATLHAAQVLRETVEGLPPELRAEVLRQSADDIALISGGLVACDGDETRQAVSDLAAATEAAGPAGAHFITEPLAQALKDGKLEQTGDDADGGFRGVLNNVNRHNSEREFVDAIGDIDDTEAGRLFQASLTQALNDKGAEGIAAAVATGDSDNVPDGGFWHGVTEIPGDVAEKVGEVTNWLGDRIREGVADALNVDGRLEELNSPGDSFTMSVGGTIGALGVEGGADVEMKVTKTEDGYEMTLMGQASAGVFAEVGLGGDLGETGAEATAGAHADLTGRATYTFEFDSLEEVTQAGETVAGIGVGTAVGGPVGAVLTAGTAGDEIADIKNHMTLQRYDLELSGSANADISALVGGAGISGSVVEGVGLEIDAQGNKTVVVNQSLSVEGNIGVGVNAPLGKPTSSDPAVGANSIGLTAGAAEGEATIGVETRIPIDASMDDVLSDPVGTLRHVGRDVIDNSTTTLSGTVDLSGGGPLANLVSQGIIPAENSGVEIEFDAGGKTKDIVGSLGTLLSGDIDGALDQLSEEVEVNAEVRTYTEDKPVDIDFGASIEIVEFDIRAQYGSRDVANDPLYEFHGTAGQFVDSNSDIFDGLQLNS